eukprot:5152673-Prymnesium_polylepis.2
MGVTWGSGAAEALSAQAMRTPVNRLARARKNARRIAAGSLRAGIGAGQHAAAVARVGGALWAGNAAPLQHLACCSPP